MPRLPKAVLQEIRSASAKLTWLFGPHGCRSSLGSTAVDCGRSSTAGAGSCVSAWYLPVERAAAVSMSLNVEPGGERAPAVGRLVSGLFGGGRHPPDALLALLWGGGG